MDIEDVVVFVAVADAGGLTGASHRLGVSKSMISRRLARLERELSAQLVSRTTRGVSLTEAGAAFKAHAERMLAELDAGREAVRQDGGEITGRLRVSASLSFGATHLGPLLGELAVRHPKLEIQASYSDRFVDLIGEGYDAAIRIGNLADSSLIARRIAPVNGAIVASPSYVERFGAPKAPADLKDHATVAQEHEIWRFLDGKREIAITPHARFVADSGPALLAAALAGVGIARLPTFLTGPLIATGELRVLLHDYEMPQAGLFVVRPPPADHVPAKIQALTALLIERFGGEPYWDACYAARKEAGLPAR